MAQNPKDEEIQSSGKHLFKNTFFLLKNELRNKKNRDKL